MDDKTILKFSEPVVIYLTKESSIPEESVLILDFGGVTFMDSSGIGLIMGRHRTMQEIGGEVIVQNPPPHIRRVLRISGIERIAKIQMDVAGRGKEL